MPERVTVDVSWRPGGTSVLERRLTEGWESGVPGLVIVREPIGDGWQLIHQASGYLLRRDLPSRKKAIERAETLRGWVDWTLGAEELRPLLEAKYRSGCVGEGEGSGG